MKGLPLSKVYQLVEPGPVVLLTTTLKGRANIMTMSWHIQIPYVDHRVRRKRHRLSANGPIETARQ